MILDQQAVLERIDYDQDLLDEICDIFKREGPALLRKLREAVECGDITLAVRHAHSLKSTAANIGAIELSRLACQAELAGKASDCEGICTLLPLLDSNLRDVLAELARH